MNEFDELYNEFFKNKRDKTRKEITDSLDKMLTFIDKLNISGAMGEINPDEEQLGPPTTTRQYEEDGITFEECTWETDYGTLIRTSTMMDSTGSIFSNNVTPMGNVNVPDAKKLTLEDKLAIAIDNEDYEEACILRDQINNSNTNNDSDSNEWNF